jgi:hypothetical protein
VVSTDIMFEVLLELHVSHAHLDETIETHLSVEGMHRLALEAYGNISRTHCQTFTHTCPVCRVKGHFGTTEMLEAVSQYRKIDGSKEIINSPKRFGKHLKQLLKRFGKIINKLTETFR